MEPKNPKLPFTEFLDYLRGQGFVIGVDHHIRLQTVLNLLEPDYFPSELKYLLCPIFATNAKQQQQFYHAFDEYFSVFKPAPFPSIPENKEEQEEVITKPPKSLWSQKWPYILIGSLLVLLIALIGDYWYGESIIKMMFTPTPTPAPVSTPTPPLDLTPTPSGPPVTQTPTPLPAVQLPPKPPEVILQGRPAPSLYEQYWPVLRLLGILTPLLIFMLGEWYHWNLRKLELRRQLEQTPPWMYQPQIPDKQPDFFKCDQFFTAARLLRQRFKSDVYRLDIEQTINCTIETGGFPQQLHYKAMTRPPEYLVLIDLPSYRDHYAQFAKRIVNALEDEGVFVTHYFYERNPRVCFQTIDGKPVYLSDLYHTHSDCRIILVGNGEELLEPISGNLSAWTELFQKWHERAFLTPVSPQQWGIREIALAQDFIILPATLDGLTALIEYFERPWKRRNLKVWKERETQYQPSWSKREYPLETSKWGITKLRNYLGEDTFQWLCACALYPELHWDLTLYLGTLPCMPKSLITEENVLRLIRLPYFREGVIPDELRWGLINALDADINTTVREALLEFLEPVLDEKTFPPKSFAYEKYKLNIAEHHYWLSRQNPIRRREELKSLKRIHEDQISQSYTLLRLLEGTPTSPMSIVLPRRLYKLLYRHGIPMFGLKFSIRVLLTSVIILIAGFFITKPHVELRPARTVAVRLFEWKWTDIAEECEQFLGPKGFKAVLISPPQEHVVFTDPPYPWWQRYQAVSYQLESRSGTRTELAEMVSRCHTAGVDVYADAVINHMTAVYGQDNVPGGPPWQGIAGTQFADYTYPYPNGELYSYDDFHHCGLTSNDDISNYMSREQIQTCELVNLADLDTSKPTVQDKIAAYLNELLRLGVAGFRIDAAKHIAAKDISAILDNLTSTMYGKSPYIFQEVINDNNDPVRDYEYYLNRRTPDGYQGYANGDVTEFRFSNRLATIFRSDKLANLQQGLKSSEMIPGQHAVTFVDNHDNQRGVDTLMFRDRESYVLANIFMLAWPYDGYPIVMSSYEWEDRDAGPPSDENGNTNSVYINGESTCFTPRSGPSTNVGITGGWVCEHRWREIANMVDFRNYTLDAWSVDNWWDNGSNQIAFGRGELGFVVINREAETLDRTLQTGMPGGKYCNIIKANFDDNTKTCSGETIEVDTNGDAQFIVNENSAAAIHIGVKVE